ncbi:hypothetical protein BLNAU_13083 [Blattamonas nauphoetae]|uniref:Uncharacterized protein n=1 Tax=Blattamonas nauphoetae TaxID=2049346 RepID=A0ABQ9XHR7_9EUKA|nr:hypothetical protein BLNAU_13083 [Blattamonas nauphoetae]
MEPLLRDQSQARLQRDDTQPFIAFAERTSTDMSSSSRLNPLEVVSGNGIRRRNKHMMIRLDNDRPRLFREWTPLIWISFYIAFTIGLSVLIIGLFALIRDLANQEDRHGVDVFYMLNSPLMLSVSALLTASLVCWSICV